MYIDFVSNYVIFSCDQQGLRQTSHVFRITGSVAFFARGHGVKVNRGATVVFPSVEVNHGNGYSATTGLFTAPLEGIYVFHLFYETNFIEDSKLGVAVNGRVVCMGNAQGNYAQGTCSAIVRLRHGDVVNVLAVESSTLTDSGARHGFSGFLLERL